MKKENKMHVNIRLSEQTVAKIDTFAAEKGMSRSEAIRYICIQFIDNNDKFKV